MLNPQKTGCRYFVECMPEKPVFPVFPRENGFDFFKNRAYNDTCFEG